MGEFNPFAAPDDADDDIFGTESKDHRHTLDGEKCPACGVVHNVIGADASSLSPATIDKLLTFLDKLPEESIATNIVLADVNGVSGRVIEDFIEFTESLESYDSQPALFRALAEVLDETTNGEISRRLALYNTEHQLIATHAVMKSINTMADEMGSNLGLLDTKKSESITQLIDTLLQATIKRLTYFVGEYRRVAEETGLVADEALIDHGIYSPEYTRSAFAETIMLDRIDPSRKAAKAKARRVSPLEPVGTVTTTEIPEV